MTALYRQFRALNRRACLGKGMSDNDGLSDMIRNPCNAGRVAAFRSLDSHVGESEFMGSKAPSGRGVHNFGIPIHNLWDKKIRNLWDSSIIYGTASQSDPCLAGPR